MKSKLQNRLESGLSTIPAEITPPRGGSTSSALSKALTLKELVHGFNVTDGSRAIMGMSSLALCKLLLEANLEPILQLSCRDRNRIALQAELLGAHALGIKNILCLTGDPVRVGDQSEAKSVQDLSSTELINQDTSLNKGIDPVSGLLPDGPINLFAGAAADPNCKGFDGLRRRIELKKKAGTKILQTQMVMEPKTLERFCQEITEPLKIPVLAGVFLLKSAKNAQFINRVVPGACIPQSIISRLENSKYPIDEGISIAAEQVKLFLGIAQGVHIMAIKAEQQISMILDKANIN